MLYHLQVIVSSEKQVFLHKLVEMVFINYLLHSNKTIYNNYL